MFTQDFPVADSADENATPKAERMHLAYDVADLPVYSQDGKQFDASVLIAFVKATVDPQAWKKGSSIINAIAAKRVLVITTTKKNHEAIIDSLKRFKNARDKQQD